MLKLNKVHKSFGGISAVNGMSLSLERAELHAIIGPNGAGKSTLLNVITGFHLPDSGQILFKGEDITGLPPHRVCQKGIGRSFQITSIFPRISVFENVQVAIMSLSKSCWNFITPSGSLMRDGVYQLLGYIGMVDYADKLAGELAQGDRKRLELAMAMAGKPDILLLDEPTAGMSVGEKAVATELIRKINEQQGLTILFIEHDIDVVLSIAKKITVMHQGSKIAEGTPTEIRADGKVQDVYLGREGEQKSVGA